MKGILLAGGKGTRLYPITKTTSKQLLPVYDKPMIYYPLATLMDFGIREVMIISTPKDVPNIRTLLGDGKQFGLDLSYGVQAEPNGIAQAFIIAGDFIKDSNVCLILGDNIFDMGDQLKVFKEAVDKNKDTMSSIFTYHVQNPERFGVVEFDDKFQAISIEEKPKEPKSNFASVGLYFYPSDVYEKAMALKPSARHEYEITDLNNAYLKEGRLSVIPMGRGNAWLDAGTPESLMDSSKYVQIIEKRQGLKLACIEEISYRSGFINKEEFAKLVDAYADSDYKNYLIKILNSKIYEF